MWEKGKGGHHNVFPEELTLELIALKKKLINKQKLKAKHSRQKQKQAQTSCGMGHHVEIKEACGWHQRKQGGRGWRGMLGPRHSWPC